MPSSDILQTYAPAFFGLAASRLVDRIVNEGSVAAASAGLRAPVRTFSLLLALRDGPSTVTELADRLRVTHAAVIKQAKPLIEAQFVSRVQDPADRRRAPLELTAKGRRESERVIEFMRAVQKTYKVIFNEIGSDAFDAIVRFDAALDRVSFDARMSRHL